MNIQDMFDFYGYNGIDMALLSEEDQVNLWSVYAYWIERSNDIRSTNCTSMEQDVLLRRRDKKVCRAIQDVIDGDYGHC